MLKKIINVTAVISTSVMIVYFLFGLLSFGSEVTQKTMPLTDLPAIFVLSFVSAVGTVLIQEGNDDTVSRKESVIRYIIHAIFIIIVVLVGGYFLGWYTPDIPGILLMILSIAFVYLITFFFQYYNGKKTADKVNKKIKDRDRNVK